MSYEYDSHDFTHRLTDAMANLRGSFCEILEDIGDGWIAPIERGEFIMRIRMALDDLDESELGAMYDEYVKDDDDSYDDD